MKKGNNIEKVLNVLLTMCKYVVFYRDGGAIFGPVDNAASGWIDTEGDQSSRDDSCRYLPDLNEGDAANASDPMWTNSTEDEMSDQENAFQNEEEEEEGNMDPSFGTSDLNVGK